MSGEPCSPDTSSSQDPPAISADEFLVEIFAGIPGRVVLCLPTDNGWRQHFWKPGHCATLRPASWYFAISTVNGLAEDGRVHRRAEDLCRTACLILDDVGTRVPLDVVTLPPSWRARSSVKLWDPAAAKEAPDGVPTDNFQVGYLLDDGGMDPGSAKLLLEALKRNDALAPAVLTAVTQPFRLPGSLNYKHKPPFATHLVEWQPQLRYYASEIAQHYNLGPKPRPVVHRPVDTRHWRNDGDDPVWDALKSGGYVLSEKARNDWYPIKCPWQDEHSEHTRDGKIDTGTAYKLRGARGAAFKCWHAHCLARRWRDLYKKLVRP